MKYSLASVLAILLVIGLVNAPDPEECKYLEKYKEGEETSSASKANRFCDHFEISESEQNIANAYDSSGVPVTCQAALETYFKIYKESDTSVDQYAGVCKRFNYKDWYDCLDMIYHLNTYCYSMGTALELLDFITEKEFIKIGGYFGITIYKHHWDVLKVMKNLNAHKCLEEFKFGIQGRSNEDKKPIDIIVGSYKDWYSKNLDSKCGCVEVIGLYTIYEERKKIHPEMDENTLFNYYQEICLVDIDNRDVWETDNFTGIAKTSGDTTIKEIRSFLKLCQVLAGHWFNNEYDSRKNSHWPFTYLIKAVDLQNESVSEVNLSLVAYAIRVKISADTFKKFVDFTNGIQGFEGVDCKQSILEKIFYSKKNVISEIYPSRCSNEKNFNGKIENLIKIYQKSDGLEPTENRCKRFTELLQEFDEALFKTMWRDPNINNILQEVEESGKSFNLMLLCVDFCIKFENKVIMELGRDGGRRLQEFRKRIFSRTDTEQICKEEHPDFDKKSKDYVKNLLNNIVPN